MDTKTARLSGTQYEATRRVLWQAPIDVGRGTFRLHEQSTTVGLGGDSSGALNRALNPAVLCTCRH